ESVTKLSATERYKYFIKRIADWESMYSLKKGDQWAISEVEETKVISFWSAPAFAAVHIEGPWRNYKIFEMDLEKFIRDLNTELENY
ncbi:MAG: DUF2750 domain-containing protein, partial [Flavitalea sp.]